MKLRKSYASTKIIHKLTVFKVYIRAQIITKAQNFPYLKINLKP
jgi:hypothetical protein